MELGWGVNDAEAPPEHSGGLGGRARDAAVQLQHEKRRAALLSEVS